jgi:molybdopterin-guanine dinucleotide biosynthesis protein A
MSVEAALLTGGASRRMGTAKKDMPIGGVRAGYSIAGLLALTGYPVTVLGCEPLDGFGFLKDASPLQGPLSALREFTPSAGFVMVVSCDLPRFDPQLVSALVNSICEDDAAIPEIGGRLQPLCALYKASAFLAIPIGTNRVMDWVETLKVHNFGREDFIKYALDERCAQSANTPEEWSNLID